MRKRDRAETEEVGEGVGGGECGVGDNTQYTTIGVCVRV